MENKKVFTKKSFFINEACRIENQLREKMNTLTTENGKKKATERATIQREELKEKINRIAAMPALKWCEISVEWKRSATWGMNPHAEVRIGNGETSEYFNTTASGCGYDKLSTVIAEAFNMSEIMKATMIHGIRRLNAAQEKHLSIYAVEPGYFQGGVGTSCYQSLFELLGYSFSWNEGKTYDHISIYPKEGKKK